MREFIIGILTDIACKLIKHGTKGASEYIRQKLRKWVLTDDEIKALEEMINSIPASKRKSEEDVRNYISIKEEYIQIIADAAMRKDVPLETNDKDYDLMDKFRGFHSVKTVQSFSGVREKCSITNNSVVADIHIPDQYKENNTDKNHFEMVLFDFSPELNLRNYCKENYSLYFELDYSENIRQVQLQIKDPKQHQFIDDPINKGVFCYRLKDLSDEQNWADVMEICFTVIASDRYISGENGEIKISSLSLIK